jgi:hypothetical protein
MLEAGNWVDAAARDNTMVGLAAAGVDEGPGESIQVNRAVYDPSGSGSYMRPDVMFRLKA